MLTPGPPGKCQGSLLKGEREAGYCQDTSPSATGSFLTPTEASSSLVYNSLARNYQSLNLFSLSVCLFIVSLSLCEHVSFLKAGSSSVMVISIPQLCSI